MEATINELNSIITEYSGKISAISDDAFSAKSSPGKWSKKEVLGHLIDSAQNNLRRFICGQYETSPPKIVYEQDRWVSANSYQKMDKKEVVALWVLMNGRIAAVLQQMSPDAYGRQCDTGKESVVLHGLQWLAQDYVKHLKHHLNQIVPNSFDIVYT